MAGKDTQTATPAIDAGRPLADDALPGMVPPPAEAGDVAPEKPKRRSRSGTSGAERRRRAAAASGDKPPRKASSTRRAPIGGRMANLYATCGVGMTMGGQVSGNDALTAAGAATVENSEAIGKAWEAAAKENPAIADALERLLTVSTVGTLLAAHVPIALAAMAGAGKVPAGLAGMAAPAHVHVNLDTSGEQSAA